MEIWEWTYQQLTCNLNLENFFWIWLEVWLVAYPVAIVCILIYRPAASKITAKLLQMLALNKS